MRRSRRNSLFAVLRRIEIDSNNRWGAVGIQPRDDLRVAKVRWSTGLNIAIPSGTYALVSHDNEGDRPYSSQSSADNGKIVAISELFEI